MPRHAAQATRAPHKNFVAFVALMCCVVALASSARADDNAATKRRELLRASDELRHAAITSTYGWGWLGNADVEKSAAAKKSRVRDRSAPTPDIDIHATASAGLVLHLVGQTLNSEPELHAAREAARGLASVQLQTGQMPATARLLPRPGGYAESVGIVPDRAPTCASLALMLLVIDANRDKPDNRIVAAATRAATWLARQPTGSGGWQAAYPPDAGLKARRLIRLDDRTYRDSTFALLLASQALSRREYALTADRCVEELLRIRIRADGATGQSLWPPAAKLGGEPIDDIAELPPGADLVATRYAMETLLGARLVTDRGSLDKELAAALSSVSELPKPAGQWHRRYALYPRNEPEPAPSTQPSDTSNDGDGKQKETTAKTRPSNVLQGTEFEQTRRAVLLSQTAGVKSWTEPKPGDPRLADRLAATACGLTDLPFGAFAEAGQNPALPGQVQAVWRLYGQLGPAGTDGKLSK